MRTGAAIAIAVVSLLASGCSRISPVAAPVVPTFPATTTPVAPAASSGPRPILPASCQSLLDGHQLDKALGLPLSVMVKSVVGRPSPAVGQTGRLSCSYGIQSAAHTYALELSLTSYSDAAAAAARVPVNVDALRVPGVDPIAVPIGGADATYLALPDGPLLIASAGIYSVTVTLGPTSFSPEAAIGSAAAVARMVFTNVRT